MAAEYFNDQFKWLNVFVQVWGFSFLKLLQEFWRKSWKNREKIRGCSLDEVLEGVSVRPLLGEGCAVSHCGEVTQSEPVLHAFVPARHLLLFGLEDDRRERRRHQNKSSWLNVAPIRASETGSCPRPTMTTWLWGRKKLETRYGAFGLTYFFDQQLLGHGHTLI